ncbi:MAG: endonuclease III [Oscillatoria princeps RMCB-10]|jgi:endonuclease-3|nr:endonuclease III [Oscillatoria princeps RMCB-10]
MFAPIASTEQRALEILERLKPLYSDSPCPLNYSNPLQLLIAVIMAAQCTDALVNKVTPELFRRLPDAAAIAAADIAEIEAIVKPVTFYRNKAKNIKATCRLLVERFAGLVPQSIEELVTLPGVARKTATMVLHYAFGIDAGVTVDTHVKRLSERLGFSKQPDLERVEKELMQILPQSEWGNWFVCLTYHGRTVCEAKQLACDRCAVANLCPSNPLKN